MNQSVREKSRTVFNQYAAYYDLLYQDKNYIGEAAFVQQLLAKHTDGATRILELGSGTGGHARHLLDQGFQLHGIDASGQMIDIARQRLDTYLQRENSPLELTVADDREARLGQTYDAVVSLFHVVSYHTTREDVLALFETISAHLQPGGVFIFDVWYGPAVLNMKPSITIKRAKNDAMGIVRIAEPVMDTRNNTVGVQYEVFIEDRIKHIFFRLEEYHLMRYFFTTEIEEYATQYGMRVVDSAEWITGKKASEHTWGVYFVLKK